MLWRKWFFFHFMFKNFIVYWWEASPPHFLPKGIALFWFVIGTKKVSKTCIATVKISKLLPQKYQKTNFLKLFCCLFKEPYYPNLWSKSEMVHAHENLKRIVLHSVEKRKNNIPSHFKKFREINLLCDFFIQNVNYHIEFLSNVRKSVIC